MAARLHELYENEIIPNMMARFGYTNRMQVPRIVKVVLNTGIGSATDNPKAVDGAMADLSVITGQRPAIRRAKHSISNFKLRVGTPIGCMVTLRRERMYEFLDRFLVFAIPRRRDFRGLSSNSFDGRGNYSIGIREQIIFPEIDYDKIDQVRGMDVTVVTTAQTDEEAFELLKGFGFLFETTEAA